MFEMRLRHGLISLSIALGCGGEGSSVTSAGTDVGEGTTAAQSEGADVETTTLGGGADASVTGGELGSTTDAGAGTHADTTGGELDGGSSGAPADGTGDDTSTEPPEGALFYEPFDAPDGTAWQEPWTDVGGLLDHEIVDGRGRLQGQTTTVGRMVFPGVDALDVDATATVIFDEFYQQGFGFYVRQNGGYLVHTQPPGQGYALYVEGGFQQLLGVWRERDGVEEMVAGQPVDGGFLESGAPYRVRFRCTQDGNQTRLQAKIWPADDAEPGAWAVDALDATPELQGVSGTLAVDIYNYQGTAGILVDDITLMPAE